jgi:hypothetical protein
MESNYQLRIGDNIELGFPSLSKILSSLQCYAQGGGRDHGTEVEQGFNLPTVVLRIFMDLFHAIINSLASRRALFFFSLSDFFILV